MSPHVIDQNFVVVEQSDETKRIRIGQGSAEGGALDNTIKFSISQGQSILDVQTIHGEVWIQGRLTSIELHLTFMQYYLQLISGHNFELHTGR